MGNLNEPLTSAAKIQCHIHTWYTIMYNEIQHFELPIIYNFKNEVAGKN